MIKTPILNPYDLATQPFAKDLEENAGELLLEKYDTHLKSTETIRLEALHGSNCLLLRALVGTQEKAHCFELFTDSPTQPSMQFGLLLDFLDGVLEEFFEHERNAGLPLDFVKRKFEGADLLVRQELRNFEAERLAEELLNPPNDKKPSKID